MDHDDQSQSLSVNLLYFEGTSGRTVRSRPIFRIDDFLHIIQQFILIDRPTLPLLIPSFVESTAFDYITNIEVFKRGRCILGILGQEGRVEGFACSGCSCSVSFR